MTPSPYIIDFIKLNEGFRSHAYFATEAEKDRGIITIGYGTTEGITIDMEWTEAQAAVRFTLDLTAFASGLNELILAASTTQNEFDAMLSLAYNIGMDNFTSSSVLRHHLTGDYAAAALAFLLWNKQRGADGVLHVLPGLTSRREAESTIYEGKTLYV